MLSGIEITPKLREGFSHLLDFPWFIMLEKVDEFANCTFVLVPISHDVTGDVLSLAVFFHEMSQVVRVISSIFRRRLRTVIWHVFYDDIIDTEERVNGTSESNKIRCLFQCQLKLDIYVNCVVMKFIMNFS